MSTPKLPPGWKRAKLRELIARFDAGVSVNGRDEPATEDGCGVLKVSAVTEGAFRPNENKAINDAERQRARINPKRNRLIMSRANTPDLVGATAYVDRDYPRLFLSDKLWQLEPRPDAAVSMRWLGYVLSSADYRRQLRDLATGSSQSMKNISKESVMQLDVVVPPLAEQEKIGWLLYHWDTAIERSKQLLRAKKVRHDAVSTRLYALSDYAGENSKFGNFLSESAEAGTSGRDSRKISIKLYGKGIVAKDEKRQGSSQTQYFMRRAGQLIYSKLDFLNGAFGIIPPELDGYQSTLDLPSFDISASVNPYWLLGYLTRPAYYTRQIGLARGQRKARRVHPSDFLASELRVPPRELQDRIADILLTSRVDIETTERLLNALQTEKQGLMQKLLTGEWRIKSPGIMATAV